MKQLLQANANVIATVAHNNVWMHFRKRLLDHVKRCHALSKEKYAALSSEERSRRRIDLFRAVDALCAPPKRPPKSSYTLQTWVRAERQRLGIDDAVGEWNDKPLLYHLHADNVARSGGGRRKGDGALPIAALDGAKACPVRQELAFTGAGSTSQRAPRPQAQTGRRRRLYVCNGPRCSRRQGEAGVAHQRRVHH